MKLICVLPYHNGDHTSATRLLEWISELDSHIDHHLLLVADNAVPKDTKIAIQNLGSAIFTSCETIMPPCPATINNNYHPAAAVMFERAMGHINTCYKRDWLWMEPDCVPLRPGWLDALAHAYENQPKRFMGATMKPNDPQFPATMFFGTAIYPQNAHAELKAFCDGKKAFDVAFSDHVVPRGTNTPLIWHVFGAPGDAPSFKDIKMPGDGPNVGTMDTVPKEAVLMHRCKDGSLIELLRKQRDNPERLMLGQKPEKRGPGRPLKSPLLEPEIP